MNKGVALQPEGRPSLEVKQLVYLVHSVNHDDGDGHDDGNGYQYAEPPFGDDLATLDGLQLLVFERGGTVNTMVMMMVMIVICS